MLKYWEVTYQIGTAQARISTCLTEGNQTTEGLDKDLQKMLGIQNNVSADRIRLVKVLRQK